MSDSVEIPVGGDFSEYLTIELALNKARKYFFIQAILSGFINILTLAGSIFMLQVYDRVIPSHSIPTLLALVILVILLYALTSLLEGTRSKLFARIGRHIDLLLRKRVFDINIKSSLPGHKPQGIMAFRDLEQIRSFLASGGPAVFFDLPWMPIYEIALFMLHPYIGLLGLLGIVILAALTWLNDKATSPYQSEANNLGQETNSFAENIRLSAETIVPLGMVNQLRNIWYEKSKSSGEALVLSSDKISIYSGLSKFFRTSLQSLMLALGAYLVITGKGTGGIMIASSILMGKALAPVELAITHWRSFVSARQSYKRLEELLHEEKSNPKTKLPLPFKNLSVQSLFLTIPGAAQPILNNINFEALAGDAIGIIGPSGSGKSTLVRALVGVWPIAKGAIRYDGSELSQWDDEEVGNFIGYVPQSIDLFSGSAAQNITRFLPEYDSDKLLKAANLAGIDNFVRSLDNGYDTDLGQRGARISAGQRQRIALARAYYSDPFVIIMDEPNSALDAEGEQALANSIGEIRKRGGIVIIVAHRPQALLHANKILVLGNGQQQAFGPKEEVLKKVLAPANK